jgi:hypothetical protein
MQETPLTFNDGRTWKALLLRGAVIVVALALGLIFGMFIRAPETPTTLPSSDSIFQSCIDRLSAINIAPNSPQQPTRTEQITASCYTQASGQLTLRDYELRRQAYANSQQEGQRINLVAVVILLFATTSGGILAGLQMLASFRLMTKGYEQMGVNSELVLKYNSIALRSSAVGVTIFAISMLFFGVYILYTFRINELPSEPSVAPRSIPLVAPQ